MPINIDELELRPRRVSDILRSQSNREPRTGATGVQDLRDVQEREEPRLSPAGNILVSISALPFERLSQVLKRVFITKCKEHNKGIYTLLEQAFEERDTRRPPVELLILSGNTFDMITGQSLRLCGGDHIHIRTSQSSSDILLHDDGEIVLPDSLVQRCEPVIIFINPAEGDARNILR